MPKSASLFALQCPKCGGPVTYDKETDIYSCKYCGISFKLLFSGSENKDFRDQLEKARKAYDRKRFKDARRYYHDALEANPDSWEADFGVTSCDMLLSTWQEYHGDEFDDAIKEAEKNIGSLQPKEKREALDMLAYHVMDAAAFGWLKLWTKVWDAWEHYDEYQERLYDLDDNGRTNHGYAEEPDVRHYEVELHYENWMEKACDLVLDATPDNSKLSAKELEIIDFYLFFREQKKERMDKDKKDYGAFTEKLIRDKLNKHNPGHDLGEYLSDRYVSYK